MTHDAARPNVTPGTGADVLARALKSENLYLHRYGTVPAGHAIASSMLHNMPPDDAIALAAELLAAHPERLADEIHEATRGFLEHDGPDPKFCRGIAASVIAALRAQP